MCPFCGCELKIDGQFHSCSNCSYIETDTMSYEEICDMFSAIPDTNTDEDIPY